MLTRYKVVATQPSVLCRCPPPAIDSGNPSLSLNGISRDAKETLVAILHFLVGTSNGAADFRHFRN